MNRYYIHNKTRNTWGWMESNNDIEVGQTVLVKFDNDDIPEMCECEVIKKEERIGKLIEGLNLLASGRRLILCIKSIC